VLFQFEIARKVGGEAHGIPSRETTKHAIYIAMDLDTHNAYQVLIKMFSARYHIRIGHYKELVRDSYFLFYT